MNARSVLKGVAAGIFAVAGTSVVHAGTNYYWTGAGADDHWTTVANWAVAGLPAESYPGEDGTAFFTNAMNVVRLDSNLTVEDEATQYGGYTRIYNDDPSTTNTLKFTGLYMLQNSTNCTFEANGNVVIETVGAPGYVKGKTLASGGAQITMDVADFSDNGNQAFVATGTDSKLTVNGVKFQTWAGDNTGVSFEAYDGAAVTFKPYYDGKTYRNPLDKITLKAVNANLYANDGNTKFTAAVDATSDGGYMDLTYLQPKNAGSTITLSNGGMLRLRGATKLPAAESATTVLTLGDNSLLQENDDSITLGKGLTIKLVPTLESCGCIATRDDKTGCGITLNSGVKFEIDCSAFKDFTGSKTMTVIDQKQPGSAATYNLPTTDDVKLTGEGAEHCTYKFTTENKKLLLTITSVEFVAVIEGKESFRSLQSAIDAAAAGDTIKLLEDISYWDTTVLINKDVTLDGNGHTVKGTSSNPDAKLFRFENAAVNVTNLTVEAKGYCQAFFYTSAKDVKAGFSDVKVVTDGSALTASEAGTVDVADCDFTHAGKYKESASEWNLTTMAAWNKSTINVLSGSYKSDTATLYVLPSGGEINVLGGTIEAETHAFAAYYDGVSPTRVVVPTNSTALVKGDFYVVCSSGSDEPFVLMGGTYDREPPETVASKFKPVADGYLAEKIGDDPELWHVRAIIPVTEVEIGGASEGAIKVGGSVTLTVTVGPDNADFKTVTWTSSDKEIATVDTNGVVTALAEGEVEITATADYGEAFDTVKITVGAGSAYPTYIGDDAEKQRKYDKWAQKYGADTDSAYEKAFLLNVAPDAAEDAEKEFKIKSITINGDTVTVEVEDEDKYNGTVEIQGAATLLDEQWEPQADGKGQKFFKAVLK